MIESIHFRNIKEYYASHETSGFEVRTFLLILTALLSSIPILSFGIYLYILPTTTLTISLKIGIFIVFCSLVIGILIIVNTVFGDTTGELGKLLFLSGSLYGKYYYIECTRMNAPIILEYAQEIHDTLGEILKKHKKIPDGLQNDVQLFLEEVTLLVIKSLSTLHKLLISNTEKQIHTMEGALQNIATLEQENLGTSAVLNGQKFRLDQLMHQYTSLKEQMNVINRGK